MLTQFLYCVMIRVMNSVKPKQELDLLVNVIERHPEGVSAEEVLQDSGLALQRRSLQRRLALLVEQRRIRVQGQARAVRYFPVSQGDGTVDAVVEAVVSSGDEPSVPVSAEGEAIKAYVRQPRHLRKPVIYRTEFLEQYHPNHSAYLPLKLREQLHALGRSPAEQTPAGTFARDILNRLLIDLSWASSQLEGNTYSRLDTARLIEFGQVAEGKDAFETQMILNHKLAIEFLVHSPEQAVVSQDTIVALHALLSDGLMPDPAMCGRIRSRAVEIGGSVYLPVALPQRLEELFGIVVGMASEIEDPFEQAFFLMVHLPYLQPFEDVNKRVSRLAANIPFIRHNLCPLSFIDVPQQAYVDAMIGVYELNQVDLLRDVFVWAYERSCQQYVAVQQSLVPPDILRLRYRQALGDVIATIVRGGQAVTEASVLAALPSIIQAEDRDHFVQLVLKEFEGLHAGNAVRFGLRPLELQGWKSSLNQGLSSTDI